MVKRFLVLIFILGSFAAACTTAEEGERTVASAPPTSNPFFGDPEQAEVVQPLGADLLTATADLPPGEEVAAETPTPLPEPVIVASTPGIEGTLISGTPQPEIELSSGLSLSGTNYYTVSVYSDQLSADWSIDNSQWVTVTLDSETAYQGDHSLLWEPYEDFASIFFTVQRGDDIAYSRPLVVGIRFWLSGGENWVEPKDLAVTAIGSNQYPYWVPNDYSVQSRLQPVFSETRLEFLDLNRDIPPGEWVPVTLLLNELQYDPPYSFVTGFYLKNDRDVLQPFYLDNVELIMVKEDNNDGS